MQKHKTKLSRKNRVVQNMSNKKKNRNKKMVGDDAVIRVSFPEDDDKNGSKEPLEDHPLTEPEEHHVGDLYITKRQLINNELKEIDRLMMKYLKHARKLSFYNTLTKTTITGSNALAAIGLYVNVDKIGAENSQAVYYVACAAATVAAVVGALSNTWNFAERAHTNATTYKSMHNLHDFVSMALVKNGLTGSQMDQLLSDMSARLILIRDGAEEGA